MKRTITVYIYNQYGKVATALTKTFPAHKVEEAMEYRRSMQIMADPIK